MGKGKRIRWLRRTTNTVTATPTTVAADYPFAVDTVTASTLGQDGLTVLARNLWPQDCQTCGWALGTDKPSVIVSDLIAFASASLHHARCRSPQWITDMPTLTKQDLLSWKAQGFLLPGPTSGDADRPVLLVNPWLEQIILKRTVTGWRADTPEIYARAGLRSTVEGLLDTNPVPDISADLDTDTITVRLDDTEQTWIVECVGPIRNAVTELGGFTLAVTTAFNPADLRELGQFLELVHTGEAAMGWIALAGTSPTPLSETVPSPEALTPFILHFGSGHASVGELLATTDRALSPNQAQAWAQETVDVPADRLIGWEQVGGDPHGWDTLDPISMKRFVLRRHTDAWKLVKVTAEISGSHGFDPDAARDWATRAARIKADTRIISWVPGPTTADGYTTLHGSGTPR